MKLRNAKIIAHAYCLLCITFLSKHTLVIFKQLWHEVKKGFQNDMRLNKVVCYLSLLTFMHLSLAYMTDAVVPRLPLTRYNNKSINIADILLYQLMVLLCYHITVAVI